MSGTSKRLLAKSGQPPVYLEDHTADVENTLQQLFAIWPNLPTTLAKAARFHDFGKAADGFQEMLLGGDTWEYRHEVLSAAIFRDCFPINEPDWYKAYLALLSHHKNFGDNDKISEVFRRCQSGRYSNWQDKWKELDAATLRALFEDELREWEYKQDITSPADVVHEHIDSLSPVFKDIETALCRGALVASDHLASAGLGTTLLGEGITEVALTLYAQQYISNWNAWSKMQEMCQVEGSALLVAPTGAGKTEAALLWALANRKKYERIFYILPYQVSINAMAERISKAFPDTQAHVHIHDNKNVSILHANMDLAYLQDALNDLLPLDRAKQVALSNKEAARKIYAPIKVTTVYQLLDIFFGRKFFEVGLLELTNALVVFDEIHAYDGHTLGLIMVLLDCLRKLNARMFIMTATLPQKLRDQLRDAAGIKEANVIRLAQDSNLAKEVRRQVFLHKDSKIENMIEDIRTAVRLGKKTVVVCNTVDKAICLWDDLEDFQPLLIHSRFTIGHRAIREEKANLEKYSLVISTQVIEVSLDISFGVMFTELAPIDDLLQRFGRVNRHGEPDPGNLGVCHVACDDDEGSKKIYDPVLLQKTRETLFNNASEEDPYETFPLNYSVACDWIEQVYPDGLPAKEAETMQARRKDFEEVVAELRPMLDPPAKVEDLEINLFETERVIPEKYAKQWIACKKQGDHLTAKSYIVNVHKGVWEGAVADAKKLGFPACYPLKYKREEYKVALFEYDEGTREDMQDATGLRLKKPIPATYDIEDRFSCDDDD